jgi:hypothetical protein
MIREPESVLASFAVNAVLLAVSAEWGIVRFWRVWALVGVFALGFLCLWR